MKIAIPTSDGLIVDHQYQKARGFLILTMTGGKIVNEEIRWNQSDPGTYSASILSENTKDCNYIIVCDDDNYAGDDPLKLKKELVKTKETIIINAINEFVNETLRKESNFCCCP